MSDDTLQAEIDRLSAEALAVAKDAAAQGPTAELKARASEIAAAIDEVRTREADPAVEAALTDAVLDVDWVRSNCMLPTSTRLHWYLQEQASGSSP